MFDISIAQATIWQFGRIFRIEIDLSKPVNEVPPEITGQLKVGDTVTATSGSWLSGGSEITGYIFRWMVDDQIISESSSPSLVLTEELAGGTLKVAVIATNAIGSTYVESDTTGQIEPADSAPVNTALPTIGGIARSGELLGATSNGGWSGNGDELLDFNYQWLADDVVMPGKTGTTLLLTDAEIGKRISLRVTATNSIGSTDAISFKTASVIAAQFLPGIVTAPAITGTPRDGFVLTVSNGTWNNGNSEITSYDYQWFVDGVEVVGATANTYTAVTADVGKTITATVTATNGVGSTTATSQPTSTVQPAIVPPINTLTPVVSGAAKQGATLTVSNGTWDDGGSEITGYTYQWRRNDAAGAIVGATASTYVLTGADVNYYVSCDVTATNAAGATTKRSGGAGPIALPSKPIPVSRPVVSSSGAVQDGETLTTTNGVWDDGGNAITAYAYAWRADSVVIPGETANTLLLNPALVGKRIESRVTATNAGGTEAFYSVQTDPVQPIYTAPVNAALPAISGLAKGGETISTTNGSWTTNGQPVTQYTYQWKADGVAIPGATASTYLVTEDEVGKVITVTVMATNSVGSTSATSEGTDVVVTGITLAVNITPPSIDNPSPDTNDVLTVVPGTWNPGGTPITSTTYQWKADGVDLPGATGTTLQLTEGELGAVITVTESVTNGTGTSSATSDGTAAVESALALSAETVAYLDAMTVQPDNDRKTAIDNLVVALKAAGVWTKIDVLGLHAAHDRQAALINLRHPTHSVTETGTLSWTADRGFTRSGDNTLANRLDWGERAAWGSANFAMASGLSGVCSRSTTLSTNGVVFGFTAGQHHLTTTATVNVCDWRAMSGAQSNAHNVGAGHAVFWAINRKSASTACLYKEKTKTQELTSYNAATDPSGSFRVFHGHSGTHNNFECSISFVSAGLTDTEWSAFVDAMRTYLTAVGA